MDAVNVATSILISQELETIGCKNILKCSLGQNTCIYALPLAQFFNFGDWSRRTMSA